MTGTRRAWRNFRTISRLVNSRLAAHDPSIAESQRDRDTRRRAQFRGNRNAFTHRLKCDYTGRLATTRDSRGTNHHRLLTCGPPATPATSVHSRGNEPMDGSMKTARKTKRVNTRWYIIMLRVSNDCVICSNVKNDFKIFIVYI